mmetsp:Transcript_94362/g.177614  ORF Transcript_94362/g.177614 Transcript_94362/m.177614 type:complete len:147 (+) Transcript_94362:69-509(+)
MAEKRQTVDECFSLLSVMLMLFRLSGNEEGSRIDKWTRASDGAGEKHASPASVKDSQEKLLKECKEQSHIRCKQKDHHLQDEDHISIDLPNSDGMADIFVAIVSLLFIGICFMLLAKLFNTIYYGRIALCESKHVCDSLNYVVVDM